MRGALRADPRPGSSSSQPPLRCHPAGPRLHRASAKRAGAVVPWKVCVGARGFHGGGGVWGRTERQTVVDPKNGKVDALSSRTWGKDAQAGTQLHSSTWV